MRRLALAGLVALAFAGAARADGSKADLAAVRDTSSVDQTGARLLQDTVRIHAPAARSGARSPTRPPTGPGPRR